MTDDLGRFEDFRAGIDLECYRNQYRRIRIVELDMPRNVQALATTSPMRTGKPGGATGSSDWITGLLSFVRRCSNCKICGKELWNE